MRSTIVLVMLLLVAQPSTSIGGGVGTVVDEGIGPASGDLGAHPGGAIPSELLVDAFSSLPGYFMENSGQHPGTVGAFYTAGDGLAVSFGTSCVAYGVPGDDGTLSSTFRVVHLGGSGIEPQGREPMKHLTNFLKGSDEEGWVTGVRSYRQIVYEDAWPGVDAVYRFEEDMLKYDLVLSAGADPSRICFQYDGQVRLRVDEVSGDLLIETPAGVLRDLAPFAYQESNGVVDRVECRLVVDGRRVSFSLGAFDAGRKLVIDPGLEFGTFFHRITTFTKIIQEEDGDLMVAGSTMDYEIPTTSGTFCQSFSGGWEDAILARFNSDASNLLLFTYIGGSYYDLAYSMDLVESGGYCLGGFTSSEDFPTTSNALSRALVGGLIDAWFMWLPESASSITYSTYLGGTEIEYLADLVCTANDEVWLAGITSSQGFPTTTNAIMRQYQGGPYDGFLTRFSLTTASIGYSTFIGADADEGVYDIELDSGGHVVMLSNANSTGFPTTGGAFQMSHRGAGDTAVLKMHKDGSRFIFSTLLGGTGEEGHASLSVDGNNNIWVAGLTRSSDFPVTNDALMDTYNGNEADAYVTHLNSDGRYLRYSTYFAGPSTPEYIELAANSTGSPIIVMQTVGDGVCPTTAFIPKAPPEDNLLVSWVDFEAGRVLNATYLGGDDTDCFSIYDLLVTDDDMVIVAANTYSRDFPCTNGSYDDTYNNGAGVIVGLTFGMTPWTSPDPPTNLSIEAGNGEATLRWEPPQDLGHWPYLGYRLHKGTASGSLSLHVEVNASTLEYTFGNLENGREYFFSLSGFTIVGESSLAPEVSVVPFGRPSAPLNLTATAGLSSVIVQWEPPEDDGGRPIEGYTIHRGPRKELLERYRDVDDVTTFVDSNVTVGTVYTYCVQARNTEHTGPMSNVYSATPYGPPGLPTEVVVMSSHNRLALSWRAPEETGYSEILGYKVYRGDVQDSLEYIGETPDKHYSDDTVVNGQEYFYSVSAFNAAGEGLRTEPVSGIPRGAPTPPMFVTAEMVDGSVLLTWRPPENDGGYSIVRYQVWRGTDPGEISRRIFNGMGVTFIDNEVRAGVTYYYQVLAINEVVEGPASDPVQITTSDVPAAPIDLQVVEGDGEVTLTWSPPDDDGGRSILEYVIKSGEDPFAMTELARTDDSVTSYTHGGLVNGGTYVFCVAAVNEVGEGPWTQVVSASPFRAPSPPLGFKSQEGIIQVTLTWRPPIDDGGRPVVSYVVYRGVTEETLEAIGDTEGTEYVDTDVEPRVTYYYSVVATNPAGEGEPAETSTATPLPVPQPPSSPIDVTTRLKGSGILVTWSRPTSEGSEPITRYMVLRGTEPDLLSAVGYVDADTLEYLDKENLRDGKMYYYTVKAENDAGVGAMATPTNQRFSEKEDSPGFAIAAAVACMALGALFTVLVPGGRMRSERR